MSDDISLGYSNREVLKLVLGNGSIAESVHPHQLQWMAHWTQASGSTCVRSHKHCAGTNATKVQTGHCCLPIESMKQSYHSECSNSWKSKLGKQDHISYMLHSVEAQQGDNGRFKIINNSVFKHGINPSGSETLGKPFKKKLPASSVNLEKFSSGHFQNSKSLKAEWSQFPMFDINRKLETLMAPKRRSKSSNTTSPLAPHLIELVSEGSHPSGQNMADTEKEIGPYESFESVPDHDFHRPNMRSSMENNEQNDCSHSGLAFKEHFANPNFVYLKHELCDDSKHSAGIVSKMNNKNLRYAGCSQTRLRDRSSSCPGDVPCAFVSKERNKGREDVCDRSKTASGVNRSNEMSSSSMRIRIGEPRNCPHDAQYSLVGKEVSTDFSQKGESTPSVNTKGTAFFEKLTIPTMSCHHGQRAERLTLVSSINNVERGHGVDIQFMDKVSGAKTDTMLIDVDETPSCLEVGSSAELQKIPRDAVQPNLRSSEKADADSSRPKSMDAFLRKPSYPMTEDTPRGSELSCKWVKRLRPNSLDDIPLSGKRFKMGDPSPAGEMKNLLAKVVNYNRSISELPDYQQLDKTTLVPKNSDCSPNNSAKVIPWIRRWCKNGQDTALPAPVLCEPENSKVPSEKFEAKQFPSLAAMALMGKQVINFRPCEFRKRGPIVVWNV